MRGALLEKFLKSGTRDFTGLNIGGYHLKGVTVKSGKITTYFAEKSQDLNSALRKLLSEKKFPAKQVKVSVKNPACLVRCFSFPKMEKRKLSQALYYELDKYIPFPPNEVYFDFSILKEISDTEVFILLAAAKKSFIDQILEIFGKNNLQVSEINLDAVCLVNLFLNNYPESKKENSCILDMGYEFSTMTILDKGAPFITRDIKFSTKDAFGVISRVKNIDVSEVEKQVMSLAAAELLKSAQDNFSNLCGEMKSSFDYFEVNKGERINKLYLSGGLASVSGIENIFTELLGLTAEVLRVLPKDTGKTEKVFFDEDFSRLKNSFSAVFGLVL